MHIQSWNACVRVPDEQYRQEPKLSVKVSVICPVCRDASVIEASATVSPALVSDGWPRDALEQQLKFLSRDRIALPRFCQSCGVSSIVPPQQSEILTKAFTVGVTKEWLLRCVHQLECTEGEKGERAPSPSDYTYQVKIYLVPAGKSGTNLWLEEIDLPIGGVIIR